ncbi:E3 ubiquitin-protein ligase BRE1-like isoform X2 [Aristolochia californica]|uniref:E3 ubiquitin-protein ligase BRE1-like isoform X2 n=1 Tax=Aristolochia californica TaxID=171875 RepID=UPI0035E1B457
MEDERKKKKNKKKKNKQGKPTQHDAVTAEETAAMEQNHIGFEQNHCTQDAAVSEPDAKSDQIDEAKSVCSNVMLEEDFRHLEAEKHSWLQREKQLEEEIKQAVMDKNSWSLKEASLEEKIKHLQNDKDSLVHKEANMEEKVELLLTENDYWIQKEAILVEQIKQLRTELESLILKESSTRETIARLTAINVGLQTQVKELDELKNGLVQENQQLVENISILKSRIQHLQRESSCSDSSGLVKRELSEDGDPSCLMESTRALVDKLVIENADLVEKVNELYIELERKTEPAADSSVVKFNPTMVNGGTPTNNLQDSLLENSGNKESLPAMQTIHEITGQPNVPFTVEAGTLPEIFRVQDVPSTTEPGGQLDELSLESHQSGGIGEIVSVPLQEDEIQEIKEVNLQTTEINHPGAVPFSDAPLIGAPFRLLSFFAKYVSGSDLVENHSQT